MNEQKYIYIKCCCGMMKSSNFDGLSSIHSPQFSILNALFSILLPQISLIQPQVCTFDSSSSILSQKNRIFDSKSPQTSVISNKMSASATCTACSFFQVFDPCRVKANPAWQDLGTGVLCFYVNVKPQPKLLWVALSWVELGLGCDNIPNVCLSMFLLFVIFQWNILLTHW